MAADAPQLPERVKELAKLVTHYDVTQLFWQLTEIAGEQTYLRHGIEVGEDDTVFDVGANVGVAAAFFAVQCRARRVHCFEPVRPICDLLRENVKDLPACVVHEFGLSSGAARVPITFYPQSAAMSSLYADPERDRSLNRTGLRNLGYSDEEIEQRLEGRHETQTLTCELRTLSSVLREEGVERVDLLKVDVERAELDVLTGIEAADWPKIRQAVIEVHDEAGRCARIEADLRAHGFEVTVDQDPAMEETGVFMLYASRR